MKLIKAPNKILNAENLLVTNIEEEVRPHIPKMKQIMQKIGGLAMAANQVGINLQFFISKDETYINPIMEITDDTLVEGREGCLSLPGGVYLMKRYRGVKLTYTNLRGQEKHLQAKIPTNIKSLKDKNQLAKCLMIQHEMDHLNGLLISEKGTVFRTATYAQEEELTIPSSEGLPVLTLEQLQQQIRGNRKKNSNL